MLQHFVERIKNNPNLSRVPLINYVKRFSNAVEAAGTTNLVTVTITQGKKKILKHDEILFQGK